VEDADIFCVPFSFHKFLTEMDNKNDFPPVIFNVKTDQGHKIINARQILYIKAERKFSVIYFDDGSSLIVYHMLKWFEEFLFPPCFFRCHVSYIINFCHVLSVDHTRAIITDRSQVPIARKRIKNFRENLRQFYQKAS